MAELQGTNCYDLHEERRSVNIGKTLKFYACGLVILARDEFSASVLVRVKAEMDGLLADRDHSSHAEWADRLGRRHALKLNPPMKKSWWRPW